MWGISCLFVPKWDGTLCLIPPILLWLPAPPVASVVNGRKVLVLGSFSQVSTKRRGVSWDRKLMTGGCMKTALQRRAFKGRWRWSPRGSAGTHTHVSSHTGQVFLKKAAEGKGNPSVKHQSTSVRPGSEVGTLLFFHLLPTARRKLLKRRRAGMALLLEAAQFVYSYSTIRRLTLWWSEDVTDTVILGVSQPTAVLCRRPPQRVSREVSGFF